MSITKKIIVTDTNIISDLSVAGVLEEFVSLDNVYICDLVKNDEVNFKTGDKKVISMFKVICVSSEQLSEAYDLCALKRRLSIYDLLNYIIARDNDGVLATGDNLLKKYSESNGVSVIRTLRIIKLMVEKGVIDHVRAKRGCELLMKSSSVRIPDRVILEFMKGLDKVGV